MHHPKTQDAERGQALVEFALTVPIFLMLVFGIMDLARLIFAFTQVIDAARQGVRYGIVEGLDADNLQYFDCSGIEDRVRDTPGLVPGDDMDVTIRYLSAETGAEVHNCGVNNDNDPSPSILASQNVVLEVTVSSAITPMTPVLAAFDDSIGFDYTSERAISNDGAYYTDTWPVGPPVPGNFQAEPDCDAGRVYFYWDPLSMWPDTIEIRDTYTNQPVVTINHPETQYAHCEDDNPVGSGRVCGADIDPDGGSGMYYMVVIHEGLEGTSSMDDTANCDPIGGGGGGGEGGKATIKGLVYYDDPQRWCIYLNANKDPGIPSLSVTARNKSTNQTWTVTTKENDPDIGSFTFTDVDVPLSGTVDFEITASNPPGNFGACNNPYTVTGVADGSVHENIKIGFTPN